jgi:thiol-disulfide isomerase/thioredoxin
LNLKNSDHRFPLYLPRILTLSEFTDYNYKREDSPFHDTVYASVFYQEEVGGMYFAMDINENQDFLDDEVIPILKNTPFRYDLPVSISSSGHPKKEMILPLKIEYKSKSNEIWVTNLLKYDIEYELGDTSLQIELNVGTYHPNFSLLTPAPGFNKLIHRFYLLSEPFLFNDNFWMLQNLNIDKQTIELVRFPTNTRPKGYKQGYYVDVDSLFADHGIPEEVQNRTDSSLFLLYFWGTWCHPCVKNMPKTNKLGQLAKGTDRLSMFGVALMSRGQVEQDIREFEKEYTLTFPSFVESFEAPHHFIRKLLNMRYPSYYLLNNKGRIIYKGENTPELWRALEKHGNIRKE